MTMLFIQSKTLLDLFSNFNLHIENQVQTMATENLLLTRF